MKVEKKKVGELERAYCINILRYKGKQHVVVASEKSFQCRLYDLEGNQEEVIWEGPGGTMTIRELPGTDGSFLATHKFYSPYDSEEAKIVVVQPQKEGGWEVRTLVDIPHVHRFDILERNGVNYLIVCTINSGCEYKDDWRSPGKIYAAVLPDDLSGYDADHQLELKVITDGRTKNHGYYRYIEDGQTKAVISTEEGVFLYTPPETVEGIWEIKTLLEAPVSDAVYMDFDGDGEPELLTLAPFHGDSIKIYKETGNRMEVQYEYPEPVEFVHAMWAGVIAGKTSIVVGCRRGSRNLILIYYDEESHSYQWEYIDQDCGSANVCHYVNDAGEDVIASANREIGEISFYKITR